MRKGLHSFWTLLESFCRLLYRRRLALGKILLNPTKDGKAFHVSYVAFLSVNDIPSH